MRLMTWYIHFEALGWYIKSSIFQSNDMVHMYFSSDKSYLDVIQKKHAQKGFWEIAPSQYFKNKSVVKPVSVIEVSM